MFVSIREFTPLLEAHCTDADRSLLERMVLLTCIEFCLQTYIHTEDQPAINSVSGQRVYDVVIPPYVDLITIKTLRHYGEPLTEKSPDSLDRLAPGWMNYPAGSPSWWHMINSRQLSVIPAPQASAAGVFVIRAVLKPSQTATHVWDRLYQDWQSELVAGALSKLLLMPKKPWSDMAAAALHERTFRDGVLRAKVVALKEGTSGSLASYPLTMGV